ncbi:unnamed protein product, partial [Durusdinium trenchii]
GRAGGQDGPHGTAPAEAVGVQTQQRLRDGEDPGPPERSRGSRALCQEGLHRVL